jgi:hypothetical protein
MKKFILLLLAVLQFISAPSMARSDVSVSVRLDKVKASCSDSVTLVISIKGARQSDSVPVIKGTENFHVTQGATSSRFEIINGQVNSGIDYKFFLQPKKTGEFKLGPVEVAVDGKTYLSNTVTLTVVENTESSGMDRNPLFLRSSLSSKSGYVEDQFIYILRLYHQPRVSNISLELPEVEYLAFRQLGKPVEYQDLYNGEQYDVVEVRFVIIPSKHGTFWIEPAKMKMKMARSGHSFFNDSFFSFSTGRPITVSSESLKLNVLSFPEEGKPQDFTGLIGSFEINSQLEPDTIRSGESATLTVMVSGRGNVNRIPNLRCPEIKNIKVYADEPVLEVKEDPKGLSGSKIMKWALVPEKEGHYNITPFSLSFFDTKIRQYRRIETLPISISVLPGESKPAGAFPDYQKGHRVEGSNKKAIEELGHDILPIHTSIKDLRSSISIWPRGLFFWSCLIVPFVAYIIAFLLLKFIKKSPGSVAKLRAKKASKNFISKCHKSDLNSSNLILYFRDYFNDRFNLSLGSLTSEEAVEILKSKGISLATIQKLHTVLKRLENDVFTGEGQKACMLKEEPCQIISQIEKEIR